jgi:NTP pyrophosphatase (non-canonical NTP hydrolase)
MSDASTVPADFVCVKHEHDDDNDAEAWVVYLGGEHVAWSWHEDEADRVARLISAALAARTAACARVAEATDFDAFQRQAYERAGEHAKTETNLAYFPLGLCEEAGEAAGVMKKHVYHGRPLDRPAYIKELGDVLWYLAMAAKSVGASLSDVAAAQIAKNHARYPEGFTREAAAVRADESAAENGDADGLR